MLLGSESSSLRRHFLRYAVAADEAHRVALAALFTALLSHPLPASLRLPEFVANPSAGIPAQQ
jgi:hypothetical protein